MSSQQIISVFWGLCIIGYDLYALKTGRFGNAEESDALREKSPLAFWFLFIFLFAFGGFFLWMGFSGNTWIISVWNGRASG